MRSVRPIFRREQLFAVIVGLADGILNALALTSGHILKESTTLDASFAVRLAVASGISGVFVFFIADYARSRSELVRFERQLNLMSPGHLARTQLGRAAASDAAWSAVISSVCNLLGAFFPLMIGAAAHRGWLAVASALAALALLGATVAGVVHGSPFRWSLTLLASGIVLAAAGMLLHVA